MDFFEVIKNRHSIREFSSQEVDDELVEKLIWSAKRAPSAGDLKDWRFFIIKERRKREALAQAAFGQEFISQAPVVIVLSSDLKVITFKYGRRGEELYSKIDVGMAAENLLLAVTALGLGAVPVGAFDEDVVRKILNIPSRIQPMLIIPVGYPKENYG